MSVITSSDIPPSDEFLPDDPTRSAAPSDYVLSVLQPGETIRAIGRLHWVIYLRAALPLVLGFAVMIYGLGLQHRDLRTAVLALAFVLTILGAGLLARAWFARWTTELAVTNHRVIHKSGFIRRHTVEMNMDKVETVNVDQPLLGRLLDYGTIRVMGTGHGIGRLNRVAAPIELRNAITAR